MNSKTKLANLLQQSRLDAGVSQKDLSLLCGWSTPQYVSNFERGLSLPPMQVVELICEAIKLDPKIVYQLMHDSQIEKINKKYKGKL